MSWLTRIGLASILALGLIGIPTQAEALDTCGLIKLPLCIEIGAVPVPPVPVAPVAPSPRPQRKPVPVKKLPKSQPQPVENRGKAGNMSSLAVTQSNDPKPTGTAGSPTVIETTKVIIRERVVTKEYDTDKLLYSLMLFLGVGMLIAYILGFKRSHNLTVKRLHEYIRPKQ